MNSDTGIRTIAIVCLSVLCLVLIWMNFGEIIQSQLIQNMYSFGFLAKPTKMFPEKNLYEVTQVVDGDTIVLSDGFEVRYLGIDTPELHHPEIGEECGGKEAMDFNASLLAGKKVKLLSDRTDEDSYGRKLRYVFTEDDIFINYEIIRNGFAQVLNIPPDDLFYKTFLDAQLTAKKEGLGIWSGCFK